MVRRFRRKNFFFFFFFFNKATASTPRHVCKKIHANIRRSDLPMLNMKWNIKQKLDPTLKPSNYKQLRKIHMFSAQKSNYSTPFLRDRPWNFVHMFYMSVPRPDLRGVFFCFFSLNIRIWSDAVHTSTWINVSKRSAGSYTSLEAAHFGRHASFFAVFR